VATVLDPAAVAAYLDLAQAGELRRRAVSGDGRATDASMRIRADCLKLLGEAAAVVVDVAGRPGLPPLRDTVDGPSRDQLRQYLASRVRPTGPPGRTRLLAMIGVVLDSGARVGEMCAMTLPDLADDLATLRVERHPQARSVAPAETDIIRLGAGTRRALRDWLEVRSGITAPLHGGAVHALWVSVRANHAGVPGATGMPVTRPPGMPLRPRGLQRAYTRAVAEANSDLVGSPGWQPLPRRFEQLRRAVSPRTETA
jgi:integrase